MHHYIRSKCIHFASFLDRKSTRLNSSHSQISYAVFCLKKKKRTQELSAHAKSRPFVRALRVLTSRCTNHILVPRHEVIPCLVTSPISVSILPTTHGTRA